MTTPEGTSPIAADLATLIRDALRLLDLPELLPRELDSHATSTVDVLGRPGVCLVATADGPVVVWSPFGPYEERMAAALAVPYLALHLDSWSEHFHLGQPALVLERGHLRLVAELRPEALDSAQRLAEALLAYLDHQHRVHDLVTAALQA
ncbi:hypothetical protein [Kitasatospora terrestris]|uniref:YbjN domain-containing protein n=1 Tax=Kitasatospora terrestris TaxID=258051 RepID=A0ABP9DAQ6_9ACTN